MQRLQPSLARRAAGLASALPPAAPADHIAFDSGHASPVVLPDLTREAVVALSTHRTETLQYAPRPGLPELRAHIAAHMSGDGTPTTPDQVIVTNGAKQAIELVCRVLLDEGDAIVVTRPTYFTAIPIFRSFGVEFIEVPQDARGMDVDALAEVLADRARRGLPAPKLVYNVPDFHNPTGVTMPRERREALVSLAADRGFFVIEDSPYRKVRFEGRSEPTLRALDRSGVVLYTGTFSKLMAPGLRVGWLAGARDVLARAVQLKSDGGSCPLTQRIIVEFLNARRLAGHIEQVRTVYRANRDAMVAAVASELPEVKLTVPEGGYYLWLALPPEVDGDLVATEAAAAGVIVISGSRFFAGAGGPRHHLRVAYSHASPREIAEGVRRLAAAYRTVAARTPVAAAR